MSESICVTTTEDPCISQDIGSDGNNAFYVVSPRKFALLYLSTLGLYELYWSYKNWSLYKDRCRFADSEDRDIWPIPRAVFSVFFIHSLFYKVDEFAVKKSRTLNWNVDQLATILVLLMIASNILSRLSYKSIGSPYTEIATLLLLVPLYFGFQRAQEVINISCGDPEGRGNSELTFANWAWIIGGSIFWLLCLAGFIMPDPDA